MLRQIIRNQFLIAENIDGDRIVRDNAFQIAGHGREGLTQAERIAQILRHLKQGLDFIPRSRNRVQEIAFLRRISRRPARGKCRPAPFEASPEPSGRGFFVRPLPETGSLKLEG